MRWPRSLILSSLLLLCPLAVSAATIQLAWDYTQGVTPAVGFQMYRQEACAGPFVKLNATSIPLATLTYLDGTVIAGRLYCWQVTAHDSAGLESAPSNVLQFQIPAPLPAAPRNLRGVVTP